MSEGDLGQEEKQTFPCNPLNPKNDLPLISHYKITPESHVKVMRIKEMITNVKEAFDW